MKIAIAADHAGFFLKENLSNYLKSEGYEIIDFGTNSPDPVDYPDFAHPLGEYINEGKARFGITICGSGNGINMTVNKYPNIRSALCWNEEISRLAREHNDANICSLPGRFINYETAIKIVDIFLNTEFSGGRHEKRVNKIPIK